MLAAERLISIALAEEGYLEKRNTEQLDEKTANAGDRNYTKYARDLDKISYFNGRKQGVAWCAVFVSWCFQKTFGKALALKLQCQPTTSNSGAGCNSAMRYYKNKGQLYTYPEWGDQVFFWSSGSTAEAGHTGIVEAVRDNRVYTIEGNTSSGAEVIANGGAVCRKSYLLTNSRIAGYGRPDWRLAQDVLVSEGAGDNVPDKILFSGVVMADKGNTVNLRASKSTKGMILKAVPIGASIDVYQSDGIWAQVAYMQDDGKLINGFMMTEFIRKDDKTSAESTGADTPVTRLEFEALRNDVMLLMARMGM